MIIFGILVLFACHCGNGQYYYLASNGKEMNLYDYFRTLGPHVDHFEITMDFVERRIDYEIKNMPKVDPNYVDFIFSQYHVTIMRGPRSLTYINHHQQSIRLRNKILRRRFRIKQKFAVTRMDETYPNKLENTFDMTEVAKRLK